MKNSNVRENNTSYKKKIRYISWPILLMVMLFAIAARASATLPLAGTTIEFSDTALTVGNSDSNSVAFGDLDEDGDLDAFVANNGPNTVWRNDGNGTFTNSGQSLGTANSQAVALADLDRDGDLDAFVANMGQPDINGQPVGEPNQVWWNSGNGIFLSPPLQVGNSVSRDVALIDVDGDGYLDAVVANDGQANKVWLNTLDTFNPPLRIFSDSGQSLGTAASQSVAVGDVDQNGELDVFVANKGEANRVWLNTNGVFSTNGQALGNAASLAVALHDIDQDGDLDAFVANENQADEIWENDEGQFSLVQSLGSSASQEVVLGDLDNDSDLDAIVVNDNQENVVWQNDGSGTFSDSGLSLGNSASSDVALADLDRDGDLDAFITNKSGQGNRVWQNNAVHRNIPFVDSGQNLGDEWSVGVVLGDLDSDGDLDAFVTNDFGEGNRVLLNDGNGLFSYTAQSIGNSSSQLAALGDVDEDGDLDAFVANVGSANANKVWLNDGSGFFVDSGQSLGNSTSISVALGDLDRDGDLDAFVANYRGEPNTVWWNNGNGVFTDSGQRLGNSYSLVVQLGDLDGDGDLDAFVTNDVGQSDEVWLNNGNGVFINNGQSLGNSSSQGVSLGDVDGDGDLDAFVTHFLGQADVVWLNNGDGTFTDSGQTLSTSFTQVVELFDFDDDGDLDAFIAVYNEEPNEIWLNDGLGFFTDSGQRLGDSSSVSLAIGDLDQDGDLDAFVVNYFGEPNKVWRNEGGSAGLVAVDSSISEGFIPDGAEDDVLMIEFTHHGIVGDRNLELGYWNLDLLASNCSTPLTTGNVNNGLAALRVRLDDGDGIFEVDGSDIEVGVVSAPNFSLDAAGAQTITFTNDDPNVQITPASTKNYWVSLQATTGQGQLNVCVRFDPDADASGRG